jgi:prevent-host-death family protein
MATVTVNIHEAKTQLSQLLTKVEKGEEVIIARSGKPIARLLALEQAPRKSRLGGLEGMFNVPDDFDTMFEKEIEEMFYGSEIEPER